MSLWKATIRKAINTNGLQAKWSNTYFVEANSSTEALSIAADFWINGERLFHNQLAFAYEFYVNNTADPPYTPGVTGGILPGVQRGARAAVAATTPEVMPLYNTLRCDFPIVSSRPSRKFYRLPLLETDVLSQSISTDLATAVQTGINFIASRAGFRDVDGQASAGAATIRGLTAHRLGKFAFTAVPTGPAFG